jgi:hypothetical protein
MLSRTLLTLSVSVILGTAVVAPSAALAQLGPPPSPPPALSGPPPGLGAGGPPPGGPPAAPAFAGVPPRGPSGAPPRDIAGAPPHFSRLDRATGPHGLDRGGQANFRGVEGRIAASSANGSRNGYAGHGYGRGYRYGAYAAAAAYAYGRSDSSSEDGCYYMSKYGRYGYRRVLICNQD